MKILRNLAFLLPTALLLGCPMYGYKYNEGWLPVHPVNLEALNTVHDDYNATAPTIHGHMDLCFSSNRHSGGSDYDIVYDPIYIEFSKTTGELSVAPLSTDPWQANKRDSSLLLALDSINSPFNEMGPLYCTYEHDCDNQGWYMRSYFLVASDREGQLNISYSTARVYEDRSVGTSGFGSLRPVHFLNSESNEAYPCFNSDATALYFCSDRGGKYDIYMAKPEGTADLEEFLDMEEVPIALDSLLSSDGNDLCPYIAYHSHIQIEEVLANNLLVFTSDREGGYGGYDLYYSVLVNGEWTSPENFGPSINSEYDEYRPLVLPMQEFQQDFMLFSSNRPGGKGGFDLYYVGIGDIGSPY